MSQTERHPLLSLLLLMTFMAVGVLIFTLLGIAVGWGIYGFKTLSSFLSDTTTNIALLKILQLFSSFGMFVIPALLFAKIESKNWVSYLKLKAPSLQLIIITVLMTLVGMPLLEYVITLNQKIQLPDALKSIEEWLRNKENIANELTKKLLVMPTLKDFGINLFMIAIIPAIGEELIFRGCLQRIFSRWAGNQHIGIWIAAILFSIVHVQFFGFFPRVLLGALFGYLLFWSGSVYLSILAHFINNAVVVTVFYLYQLQGISVDQINQTEPKLWSIYLFSFVAVIISLRDLYMLRTKNRSI